MKKKLIILSLVAIFLISSGARCTKGPTVAEQQGLRPITLNYWRVWDGPDDFQPIIAKYNAKHPNITINYRKLSYDEYEKELLNALAEDRGPDIFSINVNWLRQYQSKLQPMPTEIVMTDMVEIGTIKKELVPQQKTTVSITLGQLKDQYLDTVYKDVVLNYDNPTKKIRELRVFGLPLAMDTLATFYNKDLLNNAGIGDLSDYWSNDKFKKDLKKLTKQDEQGNILQSGMALGSGANIERSYDVLTAIMMQNGATIINDQDQIAFRNSIRGKDYNPGIDAIRFYMDFSDPTKDVYSWNGDLDNSLEMFMQGRLAILYGYSYLVPIIKAQAPKLNFSVRKFPQVEGSTANVNVADYWVEVVSKKSQARAEAWDFVQFMANNPENVKMYLNKTNRLSALRSIIAEQSTKDELSVFAEQLYNARTWYKGRNYQEGTKSIIEMIDAISQSPQENFEKEIKIMEGRLKNSL
jgi:multiple sugar transport system substrate-binding protein